MPILICLAVLCLVGGQAQAGEPKTEYTSSPPLGSIPYEILLNFGRLVSTDNLVPLEFGVFATSGAYALDDVVQDYFGSGRRMEALGEFGHVIGSPAFAGGVTVALLVVAYRGDNHRLRRMSFSLTQGLVLTVTLTGALKYAVGRERPNGEDNQSFPSGHSSTAWVCATVVGEYYGVRTKLIAYSVASLVSLSRLEKNKHYLSDVVAGAALGYLVGRTVVRGTDKASRSKQISWSPLVSGDRLGVSVAVRF